MTFYQRVNKIYQNSYGSFAVFVFVFAVVNFVIKYYGSDFLTVGFIVALNTGMLAGISNYLYHKSKQ